jgi:hypothetical protein
LIPEILPEDNTSVHRILGPLVQKPRMPILIRKWEGLPMALHKYGNVDEGSMEEVAWNIFIKFTRQMWMVLHKEWRIKATFDIALTTIEEALTNWTVDFILQHYVNPVFVPCNTGLRHAPGRPVTSFAERVNLYFLLENEGGLSQNTFTSFKK